MSALLFVLIFLVVIVITSCRQLVRLRYITIKKSAQWSSQDLSADANQSQYIVIQVCARDNLGFQAVTLIDFFKQYAITFNAAKLLEYRLQDQLVFTIASAINPGSFHLENAYHPSIFFYINLKNINKNNINIAAAFDHMLAIAQQFADKLQGYLEISHSAPATPENIQALRAIAVSQY